MNTQGLTIGLYAIVMATPCLQNQSMAMAAQDGQMLQWPIPEGGNGHSYYVENHSSDRMAVLPPGFHAI